MTSTGRDAPSGGAGAPREQPSRRAVVAGAVAGAALAAGGGLWLAFGRKRRRPVPVADVAGALRPSGWLQVAPDGRVTVWVAKSEMGQGVHTALAQLVVDQLAAPWDAVEVRQAPTDPATFGWQGTHSSSSVRDTLDTLQRAGAAAREMLVLAAARRLGVDADACEAAVGAVEHAPSGRRIGYGELATDAAALAVPRAPRILRSRASGRPGALLGTSPRRADLDAKVTGSAVFGTDVRWPGMLFAAIARCPSWNGATRHPFTRGRALAADRAAALAVRGVREVVDVASGIAVVAETTHAALAGRARLAVRWDESSHADVDDEGAARALAELANDASARAIVAERRGDVGAAFARAATTHRAEYAAPFLAHATMEPMNASARLVDGRLEVRAPVQNPHGAARAAAAAAGIDERAVDVVPTYLGGGFGRRAENDAVEEAAELAARLRVPVQVVWDRADDFAFDFHRPAAHHVLEAALDADGLPLAWRHRLATPSIVAQRVPLDRPVDPTAVEGAIDSPYATGAREVLWSPAELPVRVGFWRSVGHSHNAFAVEGFVDELAERAGEDGVAYRRRLLRDAPRELRVLDAAVDAAGPVPAGAARGVAYHGSFGSLVALVLDVARVAGTARVVHAVCAVDCGVVVHEDLARAQIEGGVVFGLSAAMGERVRLARGAVTSTDFARYPLLRLPDAPPVEVRLVPSGGAPGGLGEVAVPPVAPALAAALAALDGHRRRALPLVASD